MTSFSSKYFELLAYGSNNDTRFARLDVTEPVQSELLELDK